MLKELQKAEQSHKTYETLKLDERVQQMLIEEMISYRSCQSSLAIEDKESQYAAAVKVFDEKLNVRETEKLVKEFFKSNTKEVEEK